MNQSQNQDQDQKQDQSQSDSFSQMRFREAMDELDRRVSLLESNTLELEDSLASYERGVMLLSNLKTRLADAQQKVDVLMGQLDVPTDDTTTDATLS